MKSYRNGGTGVDKDSQILIPKGITNFFYRTPSSIRHVFCVNIQTFKFVYQPNIA